MSAIAAIAVDGARISDPPSMNGRWNAASSPTIGRGSGIACFSAISRADLVTWRWHWRTAARWGCLAGWWCRRETMWRRSSGGALSS